jgi:Transposase
LLFVGDDWAEAHHDVEVMDATGRRLVKARLPEGVAGEDQHRNRNARLAPSVQISRGAPGETRANDPK